jgi:hypothetical protein
MSAEPISASDGVPTAMKIAFAPRPAALRLVVKDQFAQARLIDRDATLAQTRHLALVNLDADHLVAEIGETSPRDKPDIAGADHHDAHQADPRPIAAGIAPPRHTWRRNTRTDFLRTPTSRTLATGCSTRRDPLEPQ